MTDFHEYLVEHRNQYKIDRDTLCKKAHINFQTLKFIEYGHFNNVKAADLLSYLRAAGFKISAGPPRIDNRKK